MILYHSTRGLDKTKYTFSQALLKGIAADGGLLVPGKLPKFSLKQIKNLEKKTYQEIVLEIFKSFETDFSTTQLHKIINKAYSKNFDNPKIAPVKKLKEGFFLLELWHGPTAAFKDMALQIMPHLFALALKKQKLKEKYLVLAATSGDTGKAALEGYKDIGQIKVIVFYPKGKVSKLQEIQMVTQQGENVRICAVKGDFDQTQNLVKQIFADLLFNEEIFKNNKTKLSSANSINWGRLIPQIVYYFSSYLDLVEKKEIKFGQEINVAVPTGNFGNILAALLAKKMGLPIDKLICASNENNAVSQFLKTGIYNVNSRKIKPTISPAMDILIASNIERFLYFLTKNSEKVKKWMDQLKEEGKFSVDQKTFQAIKKEFYGGFASDKDCLETIKKYFKESNYLFDPHTSTAVKVSEEFLKETGDKNLILIVSTAHWSKFGSAIFKSLGFKQKTKDEFEILELISGLKKVSSVPKNIKDLKKLKVKHKITIDPNLKSLKGQITEFVKT